MSLGQAREGDEQAKLWSAFAKVHGGHISLDSV